MTTPYIRHLRYREFFRVRHATKLLSWLAAQATRLGITAEGVFSLLTTNSADQVAAMEEFEVPANTVVPAITGTPTVGQTLTATTGTWTGTAPITYTYQWLVNAAPISGATESTLVLTEDHIGDVTVTVTGTNLAGSDSATSVAVTVAGA